MTYARPLVERLKPVEEALVRLKTTVEIPRTDPDLLEVVSGLTEIVRELAQNKWTAG
jgi:hypothetical protein